MPPNKKFKPTLVTGGQESIFQRHQPDYASQDSVLRAISNGITDPEEIKRLSGLPTVAQVHRTIDKLQLRNDYFQALRDNGLDMNSIVAGIRDIAFYGNNDKVKLTALTTVLKSVGMDKYEDQGVSGKDWEETLLKMANQATEQGLIPDAIDVDYEVIEPTLPDEMKRLKEAEKIMGKDMFG